MNQDTKDVFDAIANLSRLSTDLIVYESMGLDYPLQMPHNRSRRIRAGCLVRVDNRKLVDCVYNDALSFPATHVITECRGTIYQTLFEVECRDLATNELITIKL